MKKLAIITTHPIQYNAPWFKLLAERRNIPIKVFYTWGQLQTEEKFDPDFGKKVAWDIPLLEGYEYSFVHNVSEDPGSHHFRGIDNPTLIAEIEAWKPNVILVFGWNFKSHLRVIRYFKGKKPVFFRGDSNLLDERKGFSIKKVIRTIFLQWIYRHVDTALYVGSANRLYFKKMGMKDTQLVFAPHAIDSERFNAAGRNNFREQLHIPEDATVFLFAGKFESKKNPFMLMEAFIKLDDPNSYLLLVGNGKLQEDLIQRSRQADKNIQTRIRFLDFQNQSAMPIIYNTATVFVLPSQGPGETWGLSVNEAMASSLSVLVSDKCGCSLDLIHHGKNGYVFRSGEINDLTHYMEKMLKDNNSNEMGEVSKKIISEWTFEHIAVALENELNELNSQS